MVALSFDTILIKVGKYNNVIKNDINNHHINAIANHPYISSLNDNIINQSIVVNFVKNIGTKRIAIDLRKLSSTDIHCFS